MSTTTEHYHFVKPSLTDEPDLTVINQNWDRIDQELNSLDGHVDEIDRFIRNANWSSEYTPNKAIVSNSQGELVTSSVSDTELGYLSGVTSNVQTQLGDLSEEMEEVKTSVSNGKSAIAGAITDKGISTSDSDTFATMATNIRSIVTDPPEGREWTIDDTFNTYNIHNHIIFAKGKFYIYSDKYSFGDSSGRSAHLLVSTSLSPLEFEDVTSDITVDGNVYNDEIYLNGVVYGNGMFVAHADNGNGMYKSIDGINWTLSATLSTNISNLTFTNGRFIGTHNKYIAFSTDGEFWTVNESLPYNADSNIAYGEGVYVYHSAKVTNSQYKTVYYSSDLSNWTEIQLNDNTGYSARLYYDEEIGFILASKNYIFVSTDGITWTTQQATTIEFRPDKIVRCNGKYIIMGPSLNGTGSNTHYLWSKDGNTWNTMDFASVMYDIAVAGSIFVACGVNTSNTSTQKGRILFSRTTNQY